MKERMISGQHAQARHHVLAFLLTIVSGLHPSASAVSPLFALQFFPFCLSTLIFQVPPEAPTSELDSKLQSLTAQVSKGFTGQDKIKIAVCAFVDLGGKPSDFGIYLAEELITRLFQSGRFDVVERHLLDKVLEEQKLSATGVLDVTSAQKLGSVLGVQAIVTGTITDLQSSLKINARIVSAESGAVFAAASETIGKTPDVLSLLPNSAVVTSLPSTAGEKKLGPSADNTKSEAVKTPPRFAKSPSGVITDAQTGLQWYVGKGWGVTPEDAALWTGKLNVEGTGWRVPMLDELRGLYSERSDTKKNIDPVFEPCGTSIVGSDPSNERDEYGLVMWPVFSFKKGTSGMQGARFGSGFQKQGAMAVRGGGEERMRIFKNRLDEVKRKM